MTEENKEGRKLLRGRYRKKRKGRKKGGKVEGEKKNKKKIEVIKKKHNERRGRKRGH